MREGDGLQESLSEMRARLASAAAHETDLTEQLERAVRERDDVVRALMVDEAAGLHGVTFLCLSAIFVWAAQLVHMGHLEADVTARCKADMDRQLAAASQELVKVRLRKRGPPT